MSDFDRFLSESLAPEQRGEDGVFAARVQRRVEAEALPMAEHRRMARSFGRDLLALAAVAATVVAVGQSPALSSWGPEQTPLLLAGLLLLFTFWLWLSGRESPVLAD